MDHLAIRGMLGDVRLGELVLQHPVEHEVLIAEAHVEEAFRHRLVPVQAERRAPSDHEAHAQFLRAPQELLVSMKCDLILEIMLRIGFARPLTGARVVSAVVVHPVAEAEELRPSVRHMVVVHQLKPVHLVLAVCERPPEEALHRPVARLGQVEAPYPRSHRERTVVHILGARALEVALRLVVARRHAARIEHHPHARRLAGRDGHHVPCRAHQRIRPCLVVYLHERLVVYLDGVWRKELPPLAGRNAFRHDAQIKPVPAEEPCQAEADGLPLVPRLLDENRFRHRPRVIRRQLSRRRPVPERTLPHRIRIPRRILLEPGRHRRIEPLRKALLHLPDPGKRFSDERMLRIPERRRRAADLREPLLERRLARRDALLHHRIAKRRLLLDRVLARTVWRQKQKLREALDLAVPAGKQHRHLPHGLQAVDRAAHAQRNALAGYRPVHRHAGKRDLKLERPPVRMAVGLDLHPARPVSTVLVAQVGDRAERIHSILVEILAALGLEQHEKLQIVVVPHGHVALIPFADDLRHVLPERRSNIYRVRRIQEPYVALQLLRPSLALAGDGGNRTRLPPDGLRQVAIDREVFRAHRLEHHIGIDGVRRGIHRRIDRSERISRRDHRYEAAPRAHFPKSHGGKA